MATYLSPGVYIEEIATGPKPIAGLPTNIAAIIGATERGPVLDPQRISTWNDFLAMFGGFIDSSWTPENAFGFFQNGGSALWVVRADASTSSSWTVRNGTPADLFKVTASSPGAWSAGMTVNVSRDTNGGQGELFSAKVTADAVFTLGPSQNVVQVDGTRGAVVGMDVVVADSVVNSVTGTISAVSTNAGTITIALPAAAPAKTVLAAADARLAQVFKTTNTSLRLAAGSGFQNGDVVRVVAADEKTETVAVADSAQSTGVGMLLALHGTGFGADVQALDLVSRTVRLTGSLDAPAPVANPTIANITLSSTTPPLVAAEPRRLTTSQGVEVIWDGANNRFTIPAAPPGDVTLDVGLRLQDYNEALSPPRTFATVQDIVDRWGYVPVGAVLRLTDNSAVPVLYDLTRNAGGFAGGPVPATAVIAKAQVVGPQSLDIAGAATGHLILQGPGAPVVGDWLELAANDNHKITAVSKVAENVYVVTAPAAAGKTTVANMRCLTWQKATVQPVRFGITATLVTLTGQTTTEQYGGLSLLAASPRYYAADGVINDVSTLITVGPPLVGGPPTSEAALPASVTVGPAGTTAPIDGAALKTGIDKLEIPTEPAIVACPDTLRLATTVDQADVYSHLTDHCLKMRRFGVIDLPHDTHDQDLVDFRQTYLDSTYAAAYAPFVTMVNPRLNPATKTIDVPASGFIMGVYARTDNDRGVWKAPANERVTGIVGLTTQYTKGRQDYLNPRGINLLRAFPGRGFRIWGARNLTDDTDWRYVNVRRLFLMLENSIDAGTQWVVFEPNDQNTWMRVRVSVENFLNGIWRAGGLFGATPAEAYRVTVGLGQTMTQTDIDLGLLVIEIAVAPVKPAEFVVFRISHLRLAE